MLHLVSRKETNEFYNPRRVNNGGGYSQPELTYKGHFAGKPLEVIIQDTSCGDFGSRYAVYCQYRDNLFSYFYSFMSGEERENGNIPKGVATVIELYSGYNCTVD